MQTEETDADTSRKTAQEKQKVLDLISQYTKHKHVKLVQRGNAAIFCALYLVKKVNPKPFILIPDQGGWISFQTYPKILGFEIRTVKTNRGLIDLIDLEKKAESGAALLLTSFAGYFAEQPMKYVSKICRTAGCLIIEDASGAVGDSLLCDGNLSDIIVGSFGRWKPVNAGYGGFISVAKKEYFDEGSEIFSTTNHYAEFGTVLKKLKDAPMRLEKMFKLAASVKEEIAKKLPDVKIIHKEARGLNVVAVCMTDADKAQVLEYCKKKSYETVLCPQYTRLEEDAISIELKRIS